MPSKKCFSKCRKLSIDECSNKPTFCRYTKGKRQYCRLNKGYYLGKNCDITKRRVNKTKKNATSKIKKFIIKTTNKRRATFLKTICSDSGVCMAFGTEIARIRKHFDNFLNFDYIVSPVKKIGAVSSNGFVKEIKYEREGYEAYTVLKSSAKQNADNLMYEYEVGQYINKQNKIYPCFLETYGVFLYNDDSSWKHAKDSNTIVPNVLKNDLTQLNKIDYSTACLKSKYIAIMIQHIKNAMTFRDFYKKSMSLSTTKLISRCNHEIICVLYQIYMPLAEMHRDFTHYDLHDSNVLLYEPLQNSYITYNYHLLSGETITFKSKYIAKIIDYGRSYYFDDHDRKNTSRNTYRNICSIKDCDPNCGEKFGLSWLEEEDSPGDSYFISSQKRNSSHDLRFAHILATLPLPVNTYLHDVLKKIVYKEKYGTKEILDSGLPNKIHNVVDMRKSLEEVINRPTYKKDNDIYFSLHKNMGKFDIYQDKRPMRFTNAT